jgi:metal-sulfur cluster biosynthetic enzyme
VLGLVYEIDVQETHVKATVSLTSPFCPVAGQILDEAKAAIEGVEGVESAEVELTFQPPWTPERIDPLIRASLGI